MADNLPPVQPDKGGTQPPLPSSGQIPKAPTTQLPRIKKPGVGKIVVMLSSVAKSPATQLLPKMPVSSTGKLPPVLPPAATQPGAVPLPPKQMTPASLAPELAQSPLSTTTYVRLPPKTAVPRLNLITGPQPATPAPPAALVPTPAPVSPPTPAPETKAAAYPAPKKPGAQHIPPIRLGDMGGNTSELPGESILLGPTDPKPTELKPPTPSAPPKPVKPPAAAPAADTPAKSSSLVAPPLVPPRQSVQTTQPMKGTGRSLLPKPGGLPSVTGKITVPSSTLTAPPLTPPGRLPQPNAPAAPAEPRPTPSASLTRSTTSLPKPAPIPSALSGRLPELRPPPANLPPKPSEPPVPGEAAKPALLSPGGTTPAPGPTGIHRVPAMIQPDLPSTETTARAPGPKPAGAAAKPVIKLSGELRKSTPLVLSSTSKIPLPNIAEVRAALRPPALPRRTTPLPVVAKQETVAPVGPATPTVTPSVPATVVAPASAPQARPVEPVIPPPLPPPALRGPAPAAAPISAPVAEPITPPPTPMLVPVVSPAAPLPVAHELALAPPAAPVIEPAAPSGLKVPEPAAEVAAKLPPPVEHAKVSDPPKPPVLPPKPPKPDAPPPLPPPVAEIAPTVALLEKPSPPVEPEKSAAPPQSATPAATAAAKPPPLPPPLPPPAMIAAGAKAPEPVLLKDLPVAAVKSEIADHPPVEEKPAPPTVSSSIIEPLTTSPKPTAVSTPVAEAKSGVGDVAPVIAPEPVPEPAKLPPPLPVAAPVPVPSLLVKSTALPSSKTRMLAQPVEPVEPAKLAEPAQPVEPAKPAGLAKTTIAADKPAALPPPLPIAEKKLPPTRAERAARRSLVSGLIFYLGVLPATLAALFFGTIYFGRDTRVEGQVIPPQGTILGNEVWIVTDFRSLAAGVADDLARDRAPKLQDITEKQDHVQRAQADIATREARIRLMQQQIDDTRKQIDDVVKQSRAATQQLWDTDGAEIDAEYSDHMNALQQAIADRAKSLKLDYEPDPAYPSPEVWANAYRLALYQVPAGVDSVKEHQWLGDQMKAWRDFEKTLDDRKEQLREKAAALKLAPAPKITDLNAKIDDLQQRMDSTAAEEVPLKTELVQAQADLLSAQDALASADDKYMKELLSLPDIEVSHTRIPLAPNGRFTWMVDPDSFGVDQKTRHYWIFSRATRPDGRQYWALHDFDVSQNQAVVMMIEPGSFMSTKAILRPDLSPDEQDQ